MPKIALPNKGRLCEDVRSLLRDAGLEASSREDGSLGVPMAEDFFAIFVRAQDIPGFVADGAADAGITGLDCVEESGRALELRADLGLGRCRLALAAPTGSSIEKVGDLPDDARVATSFPRLTGRFFEAHKKPVRIVEVSGAAEVTPQLGVADAIVDLVATGSTLRGNGLVEVTTLLTSTAQLVSRPRAMLGEAVERAIADLALALESVLRARSKRYLMANVPRAALDAVGDILPGLNGPTVVDVAGSRFVAVHAVVDSADVYRTTVRLKTLGCEGILVTRIERLMS
jgi:ATP phosphoribosyltransferase